MTRIGIISKVDQDNGMAEVIYDDKDESTTGMLPILKPFTDGEFKAPDVGDYVVVSLLSNGSAKGVIMGSYYNTANNP